MITQDGKLEIFEEFVVDRNLPKFKKQTKTSMAEIIGGLEGSDSMMMQQGIVTWNDPSGGRFTLNSRGRVVEVEANKSALRRFWLWFVGGNKQNDEVKESNIEMSVEEFFTRVGAETEELKLVEERAAGYVEAIARAEASGQVALREKLQHSLLAVRSETVLVGLGYVKYLEEEKIVEFVKKSPRGLRLDWVANFVRHIPEEVVSRKKLVDEAGVFDNYVVLHYDPKKKAWAETQAQARARKDPILFGVIQGRRRLYFVGDWKDETCDLTLDQIADLLGKEVVKEIPKEFVE